MGANWAAPLDKDHTVTITRRARQEKESTSPPEGPSTFSTRAGKAGGCDKRIGGRSCRLVVRPGKPKAAQKEPKGKVLLAKGRKNNRHTLKN